MGGGGGFGGGQGSAYGYTGSGGGSGLGGVIFNHIGTTVLVRATANSNGAAGGAAGDELLGHYGPAGASLGSIVFDLNGAVAMENSSLSSLVNTASSGSVYVESDNGGVIASGQTSTASFVQQQSSTLLAAPDLIINQANGTTTSTSASMPEVTLQPAVLSLGVSSVGATSSPVGVTISNIGTSTLTISSINVVGNFSLQNTCATIAAQSSCTLEVVFSPTAAGTSYGVIILNDNAPEATQVIFLNGAIGTSQTISFSLIANQLVSASPLTLTATASSGLAVSFASTTNSVCTVSGNLVTLSTSGTCTIQASQAGGSGYVPATSVEQSFQAYETQSITFGALPNQTFGAVPFSVSATASSNLPVTFSSLTLSVCTVSGSTVTLIGRGECIIEASQAGNAVYPPATPVQQGFLVANELTSLGSTSATQTATVTVNTAGTVGQINVLTQGVAGKDFAYVSGGTCTVGQAFTTVPATCTVQFSFTPSRPGPRPGAVSLTTGSGSGATVLGMAPIVATGAGPLVTFPGSTDIGAVGKRLQFPHRRGSGWQRGCLRRGFRQQCCKGDRGGERRCVVELHRDRRRQRFQ